jgi:DUF1680 family protein
MVSKKFSFLVRNEYFLKGIFMDFKTIHFPGCDQVVLTGRLSTRYQGNQQFLTDLFITKKDWLLEPFQNRGKEWVLEPLRNRKGELPWAGEYAGKWLDAVSLTTASHNEQLSLYTQSFVTALIATQEVDGYLGIELPVKRGVGSEWDNWNIKYAMTGLLTHYEVHQDEASLRAGIRCGEWLIHHYGMIADSSHPFFRGPMDGGVNVSILDQVARLYRITGNRKFLEFASSVTSHYLPITMMRTTHQAPSWHAYNLLCFLNGVVELAIADNRKDELFWVERVWEDLISQHVYPTGSLSFNELLAELAPNDTPVIDGQPARHHQETCATVEWLLFNALLFQATGRIRYMERIEQTIYNALLAAQSMDGMKWMYFTPLRYEKRWFTGPTSCCYYSGPRGVARIPAWIYALDNEGIRVNLYESSSASFIMNEVKVILKQSSLFPDVGKVTLQIIPDTPLSFTLRLRIPSYVGETRIQLNGNPMPDKLANDGYYQIQHKWSKGDQIVMEFGIPTTVHRFLSDQYGIVVRGSEVFAVDQNDNPSLDIDEIVLQEGMTLVSVDHIDGRRHYMGEVPVAGQPTRVIFTPYADCGNAGSLFRTAFPTKFTTE